MLDAYVFNIMPHAKLASVSGGTTSHPYACRAEILGREREEMKIKDAILNHVAADDSVLVAAIVGMGGIGKTSLTQLIYHDPSIRSKFEIMLWVNATDSEGDYDTMSALYQMRMQLGQDFTTLEEMLIELYALLRERRFFVMVDDVWSGFLFRSVFSEVLHTGSKGSVILVNTPVSMVAHEFEASVIYVLDVIPEDVSYKLFAKYAFDSNGQIQPEFADLAREIVKKCGGLPMLVKMIGTYLYNKDTLQQWTQVVEVFKKVDHSNGIIPVFTFIYHKLPSYLKLPFCTLPLLQDYSVEELICMWMALGFVHSDDPNQQLEYIGRKYLKELAESALCLDVEYAPGGVVKDIKMHDLVEDMAIEQASIQGLRRCRVSYTQSNDIDSTTKYLILDEDCLADSNFSSTLCNAKELRLFMLCLGNQASAPHLMDILSDFKCLQVLGLGGCGIKILPDFIGQLKHLRYLDVGRNVLLSTLPDSICNLWHLQTLLLHGCDQLKGLPTSIGKLQNLRYLTLTTSQESLQEEIGQLTSLRTLGLSSCQRLVSLPFSLKNLKNLQTLGIVDCPKMSLVADSSVEALSGMDVIDTLLLSGLLEFERLPPNLGARCVAMKHLLIQFSNKLTEIAWINQFLFLHSLTIEKCPGLSTLMTDGTSQFNKMEELVIRDCPGLGDTTWIRQFVSLRSLIIDGCPNLVALDASFVELKKLERLEIRRCPLLVKSIQILGGVDSSYTSHVRVVELDGVRLPRLRRIYGKLKKVRSIEWLKVLNSRR